MLADLPAKLLQLRKKAESHPFRLTLRAAGQPSAVCRRGVMMGEQLVYQGTLIRERDEMLSLTDMWRAGGSVDAKRPAEWLRQEATVQFIECIEASLNVGQAHIIAGQRGRGSSTFAHWQVALAYAKYLSPEFHMWCSARAHGGRPKCARRAHYRNRAGTERFNLRALADRAVLAPYVRCLADLFNLHHLAAKLQLPPLFIVLSRAVTATAADSMNARGDARPASDNLKQTGTSLLGEPMLANESNLVRATSWNR